MEKTSSRFEKELILKTTEISKPGFALAWWLLVALRKVYRQLVKQIRAWLMAEPDHQQYQFFRKPLSFVRLVVLISDRLPSPNSFYAYCYQSFV
ncbi:MAG: hypothetical protein ACKO0V_23640 [bacterium]